jgi:aryl-alcohol dehydrogenase-like predicted oxidoreductase
MLPLCRSTIDIRVEQRRSACTIVYWAKPAVSSVIIGAKSAEQLHDNIASTRVQLSAVELEALDAIGRLPAEYPGWMLSLQG